MTNIPNTILWIPPGVLEELMFYTHSVDAEVGGLGYLQFDKKENDIFVRELYLLDQEVHSSECTLSAEGIAKLYEKLFAEKKGDMIEDINFWWHSHKDMGSFFSGTDDTTMREWPGKYLVALVINRKGELKARLMSTTPVLIIGEIEARINWLDAYNAEELKKSIDEKVKKWTPPVMQQQIVVPGQQQIQGVNQFQGTPRVYGPYAGWQVDNKECKEWTQYSKKTHEMTEDEWDKAQVELDAEMEAWEKGDLDGIIKASSMDETEIEEMRKIWAGEA